MCLSLQLEQLIQLSHNYMSKSKIGKDKYKVHETNEIKNDWWSKVKEEDKKELNEKAEAVKSALKSDNVEEIKKTTEELSKVAQRIGGEMYKQQQEAEKAQQAQPKEEAKAEEEAPKEETKK